MKNILGLDLGTNSIGWAKVSMDDEGKYLQDIVLGSRIIPMSEDVLSNFDKGITVSQTALRTGFRSVRRLRERCLLRRERLHRVLHVLGFLPEHYDKALGWDRNCATTYGKFLDDSEPKLAWKRVEDGHFRFLFMDSFKEMVADFGLHQPTLVAGGRQIPLDWTVYYLRKKALSEPILKEELAWLLLNFNQKRGYYQLRGEEEEENPTKKEEYEELKVVSVEATEERKGDAIWYHAHLENGWIYRRQSKVPLDNWVGQVKAFIVTTEFEKDGVTPKLDKNGEVKRSLRAPSEDDWALRKKRTEKQLENSGQTVGCFIYDRLLAEPSDKIRGNFVRTIERKYYKDELRAILRKQMEFHPALRDDRMLRACIAELYQKNEAHRKSLLQKDMEYLLVDDLLFYQRPLKSKKSLIANCPYERHLYEWTNRETGEIKRDQILPIKCIAKSNPYFQEFRLWQFVHNLRLFRREDQVEVTGEYLSSRQDYVRLFLCLNDRKEIKMETVLKDCFGLKKPRGKDSVYPLYWNYVQDKVYPGNETRYEILSALGKAGISLDWADKEDRMYRLWHLLYSVSDRLELKEALRKLNDDDAFVEAFLKVKPFKKDYGAYSEKAVKKLLAVMRMGSLWHEEDLCAQTKAKIAAIIEGRIDSKLKEKMGTERVFTSLNDFQGLPLWLACYVVYGRHSEVSEIKKWETPEQLMTYIRGFKQHSMRNPIVEQCVLETLRTVHDLWKEVGHIDEIHVELGRSMKKTAEQRERDMRQMMRNENTNLRIKHLLMELKRDQEMADVRPYSPMQQEILRIYEEGALLRLTKEDQDYDEIMKISQQAQPSQAQLTRYKLWLEQKYVSPYTGRPISLSKLFTPAYQIEHVIPQSRFFDDSLMNKVICEAEVNLLKGAMLGYEFIKAHGGEIVHCTMLGDVRILSEPEYKELVDACYTNHQKKRERLLAEDIPEGFLARQMNDTRYISRVVMSLLSNVVREKDEEEATSKNVIPCTGGITDQLKKDWGLKDVWNTIVTPRFERLNELTKTELFGRWENKEGKRVFQTDVPLELQQGYSKKRIDHRHHAMDALVIACASRSMINYLNNESAKKPKCREDLRIKLCDKNRVMRKPWETFTQDALAALENVVVSFKNHVRVINKATNYYEKFNEKGKKVYVPQRGNALWAIRKSMHKDTVFGEVNLRRKALVPIAKALENIPAICNKDLRRYIDGLVANKFNKKQLVVHFKSLHYRWNRQDVSKVEVILESKDKERMVATRKLLDTSFDKKRIGSITDTGIQKILLCYLETKGGDPAMAFTPDGIAEMNRDISLYNGGKRHQPILKVRVSESKGAKFQVGEKGAKGRKFVEAQKGTNLYFAIYEDREGIRSYSTEPLDEVAERLKQDQSPVPEKNDNDVPLKYYLSPNDLVYVPSEEERMSEDVCMNKSRIYRFVDASGTTANFVPHTVASLIYSVDKKTAESFCQGNIIQDEFGVGSSQSKNQRAITGEMVKAVCWKLEVDRLGKILKIIR